MDGGVWFRVESRWRMGGYGARTPVHRDGSPGRPAGESCLYAGQAKHSEQVEHGG